MAGNAIAGFLRPARLAAALALGLAPGFPAWAQLSFPPVRTFGDVAFTDRWYGTSDVMRERNITLGCYGSPALLYCPDRQLDRATASILIIRAIYSGLYGDGEAFTPPSGQYFNDVPPTHTAYRYIQQMKYLNLTTGCTDAYTFCPEMLTANYMMAILTARARYVRDSYGAPVPSGWLPPYSTWPQRFADIPYGHPYFLWVQRAYDLVGPEIYDPALGGAFHPDNPIARGQASFYFIYGILGSPGLPPNNLPGAIAFWVPSVVNGPNCALNAGPYYTSEVYQVTADSYYSYSATVINPGDVTLWVSGLRTSLNRSGVTVFDSNEVQGQNSATYRYPASGNATLIAGNYLQTSYHRIASGACNAVIPSAAIQTTYWPANGQATYLPVSLSNPNGAGFDVTASGKGPPTAATLTCGKPNCTWMGSKITYPSSNMLFGESFTWTTGPSRGLITNYSTARMRKDGVDLGLACSVDSVGVGDYPATARVPCSVPTNFYLYSPSLFTLVGQHRGQAYGFDTGIIETYDHLGTIAAGATRDFSNLPMWPFCDFRNATGPTVLPSNDGVTAQYTARTINTVSFRVTAPYTARKGFHQLGFPANDSFSQPRENPFFALIVYDGTPVISSVTPNPIVAGAATTITVTGLYFGDHPTVYVAGTSYNPGAPSKNAQAQDVLSFQINLPAGLAGSPVPVYMVSNGAGGQPFWGAPQGAQQGSPTSNTVQVQAATPPTISGLPGMWYLGTADRNDNCVPGSSNPSESCYYNSTLLTLTPGAGGTPPSAGSPATWSLTFEPYPPFATYTCDDPACSRIVLRATSQPPSCGTMAVQATLGGISSAPFTVHVDWPSRTLRVDDQNTRDDGFPGPPPGYISYNNMSLVSACGSAMFGIAIHEEFPGSFAACRATSGWTDPIPQQPEPGSSGWAGWVTDAAGRYVDTIAFNCDSTPAGGSCNPPSTLPGPFSGQPLSTEAEAWVAQFIFVGSLDTQNRGKYFAAEPNMLVRYRDHGRFERGTWRCGQ